MFQNEPHLDFSQESSRRQMEAALQATWRQFGTVYPLVINGEEIATPETSPSLNPAHKKEVVGYVARATREYVERAVAGAKAAWPAWRDTAPATRADCLRRAAEFLVKQRVELAAWEVFEVGKNWREADADVTEAIDFLRYYATEMVALADGRPVNQVPGEQNRYVYIPRGVGVVIAPWNFPLAILTGMTAAALVTGNAIIVKPSSQSAVLAAKLVQLLHQAGIPPGILQFLPGPGGEIGAWLVEHPDIQFLAFTGSRTVGLSLAERAARGSQGQRHVKKVIAEMGGKNAIVI
ncbi:MAG: aldehyde dehydrogenase family protein, partial [Elusimicrobia bacterium]|nr:aldehyde dehydrogenase family protein [Elusimicrobiota bacterium]